MNKELKKWLIVKKKTLEAIKKENKALEHALRAPLPKNLRPATADDIKVDAIIWYPARSEDNIDLENDDDDWCPYWTMVDEPLYYGDLFKAFHAMDGCRYGLNGAFVEVDE